MRPLFMSFRFLAVRFLDLLFALLNFVGDGLAGTTLPPDHPQSITRRRSYRQCWHRLSFGGGAFVQASPV